MKTFITFLLCSFLINHCAAQMDSTSATDQKIISKITELKARKIDTLLSYYVYCSGRPPRIVASDTSCYPYDVEYLFWINKGKCLMQRFDECRAHQELQIEGSLFKLIRNKYWSIAQEKIKPPEYTEIVKGKKTSYSVFQDHTCVYVFQIYTGNIVLKKQVDDFDLDSKFDNKHLNKSYHYNQNTSLNELKKLVAQQIARYYPQN